MPRISAVQELVEVAAVDPIFWTGAEADDAPKRVVGPALGPATLDGLGDELPEKS